MKYSFTLLKLTAEEPGTRQLAPGNRQLVTRTQRLKLRNSHPIRNFTQRVEFWPLSATFAAD